MDTVSVTQAKARLSELLDRVEAGQEIVITRRGKAVAHLSPVVAAKTPLRLAELTAFRATMPRLDRSTVDVLREMRDEGY